MSADSEMVERVAKWAFFKKYGSNYAGPTWLSISYGARQEWISEALAAIAGRSAMEKE